MRPMSAAFILLLALITSAQCQQTEEDWYNKGILSMTKASMMKP